MAASAVRRFDSMVMVMVMAMPTAADSARSAEMR
jgi:hypothetical protein